MGVGSQLNAPVVLTQGHSAGSHCAGGCVGPRAGLERRGEVKIGCSDGDSEDNVFVMWWPRF